MEQLIGGRYRLQNLIGSGGMGSVYKGTDTQTDQILAIKQLKPDLTSAELIERFQREGEALRELNHPNIVKMLDSVEEDDQHYLVMEYVDGSDLSHLLESQQLPLEQILNIAIDLADALTRAHRLQIIHRDLKPANILIGEDGVLRLTDFGVAHVSNKDRVTGTDTIVGTIDYLAPEAFDGVQFDERGDIWAFGVLLYEMLVGQRPFGGDTLVQVIQSITVDPVPDIQAIQPDIPIALVDLVYRMLEKDPNTRIRSVRLIGLEIEDLIQGRDSDVQQLKGIRFETPLPDSLVYQPRLHNLPTQTTPFVGRETEIAELTRLLDDPKLRLLTILAPGGMGKTRLSLEIASRLVEDQSHQTTPTNQLFSDGAFFVALAPLTDTNQIIPAIADATDYHFLEDGRSEKQQVYDFLKNKHLLLVMDNYEHLMAGVNLVQEILNIASHVQILVTSRQRMGLTGETVFHLGGMDFPDWETPEDALEYAAVKLFVNSAMRAQPAWELTEDNLDHVARICRLVQGMPLAIVLAAAWLAMLTESEIVQELEGSMDILSDELGELPERQRSIRAVMDYSWQIMSPSEQAVFMKLAVFYGGFTRDAAQAIAGANLRVLMSLVNKSLLSRDADSGRYHLHEFLRQYAREKLQASGEEASTRYSHSQYFMKLGGEVGRKSWSTLITSQKEVEGEHENLVTAWRYAIDHRDEQLIDSGIDMSIFFWYQLKIHEVNQLLLDTLAIIPEDNLLLRAKVMALLPYSLIRLGRVEDSMFYIQQSQQIFEEHHIDDFYATLIQFIHATFLQFRSGVEASIESLNEIAKVAEDKEYTFISYTANSFQTYLSSTLGKIDEAEANLLEDLRKADSYQNDWIHRVLMNLGEINITRGNYRQAKDYFNQSLALGVQNRLLQAIIDNNALLGATAFFENDFEEMDKHLTEVEILADKMGIPPTSTFDASALRARYYLATGDANRCYAMITDLLPMLNLGLLSAGLTIISAVDWLIHDGRVDKARHILDFLISQPITLVVRRSANLMLDQLGEATDDSIGDGLDEETLLADLRTIFKTSDV